MYLHPTNAVTPERVPLGVLDAWMWAREPKDAQGKRGGLKESLRWIEGYERVAETASSLPHTRLVYVADSLGARPRAARGSEAVGGGDGRPIARVLIILVVDAFHNRMRNVEAGEIHQLEGAHAEAGSISQDGIDLRDGGDALAQHPCNGHASQTLAKTAKKRLKIDENRQKLPRNRPQTRQCQPKQPADTVSATMPA